MVNESVSSHKSQLLTILRNSSVPINGDTLGSRMGISRVAVHKHIHNLKTYGYPVVSSRHGYRIGPEETFPLSSWEFLPEEHIRVVKATGSTMNEARLWAEHHPGMDFTMVAEFQSAGRGRRNRTWNSPEGGLWATHLIHPGGSAIHIQRYVLAATAALARLLREKWKIEALIKWPNDILVDKKKIAGVLGEARINGDRIDYLSLGLGLNVNNEAAQGAAALKDITGRDEDRRRLLRDWIEELKKLRRSADFSAGKDPLWLNSLMTGIGSKAVFQVGGQKITGIVAGIDGLGRLMLRTHGESVIRLSPGDIDDTDPEGQQRKYAGV